MYILIPISDRCVPSEAFKSSCLSDSSNAFCHFRWCNMSNQMNFVLGKMPDIYSKSEEIECWGSLNLEYVRSLPPQIMTNIAGWLWSIKFIWRICMPSHTGDTHPENTKIEGLHIQVSSTIGWSMLLCSGNDQITNNPDSCKTQKKSSCINNCAGSYITFIRIWFPTSHVMNKFLGNPWIASWVALPIRKLRAWNWEVNLQN